MRRLIATASILMATASLAPFTASAITCNDAPLSSVPLDPATRAQCQQVLNLVPAQGCRGPVPQETCQRIPAPLRPPQMTEGANQNVLVMNNTFNPADTSIVPGQYIYFQNLDGINHTITSDGCETVNEKPCATFNKALEADQFAMWAQNLYIDAQKFFTGQVYNFKCTVHEGMTGKFSIAAIN